MLNEITSQILFGFYWIVNYIIPFLLVLTPVVFFHELGHFVVARWNGIDVKEFSVGFGPELVGKNDSHGTRWKICAFPLGGYVKFMGDTNISSSPDFENGDSLSEKEKTGSFMHKSVGRRALVVMAGPLANFILAIVIFTISFMIEGKVISDPVIAEVQADSPAEAAGLKAGDRVLSLYGSRIDSFGDIPLIVVPNAGREMTVIIVRGGAQYSFQITPQEKKIKDRFGNIEKIGFIGIRNTNDVGHYRIVKLPFPGALGEALDRTWYQIRTPFLYITDIITGKKSSEALGGPIRIAKYSNDIASQGYTRLIQFIAFVSVAIGLMNLFPIPLLDGGHLLFYAIEAIKGKPLSKKTQEIAFAIGYFAIFSLIILTTYNDIVR